MRKKIYFALACVTISAVFVLSYQLWKALENVLYAHLQEFSAGLRMLKGC